MGRSPYPIEVLVWSEALRNCRDDGVRAARTACVSPLISMALLWAGGEHSVVVVTRLGLVFHRMTIALAGFLFLSYTGWTQPTSALENYRQLQFPAKAENFAQGWQERVALEYEIINAADLKALRIALKDQDPFVRAIAARALGILGDKDSADALAELVKADKEYLVRIRAVESLGYLKEKPEVIQRATKDRDIGVTWVAKLAADQLESDTDYARQLREAYSTGIKREDMGTAKVGQPAPDFTAQTSDGKPFRLSTILGKKPIALYFTAYDG